MREEKLRFEADLMRASKELLSCINGVDEEAK